MSAKARSTAWLIAYEHALSLRCDLSSHGFSVPSRTDITAAKAWADVVDSSLKSPPAKAKRAYKGVV